MRGIHLTSRDLSNIHQLIREYIEHAPALLDQLALAAKEAHVMSKVSLILESIEEYFFAPFDVIPDQLGLLGLVDDAYLAHRLIETMSNWYQTKTGTPLISVDLSSINMFIRSLIGEPHASMLDLGVQNIFNGPSFQQSLIDLLNFPPVHVSGPDPMWGYASMDEVVNARLGAMGVV
jgi:uncharacterized membrane protein YkvA (DUF1232 family)